MIRIPHLSLFVKQKISLIFSRHFFVNLLYLSKLNNGVAAALGQIAKISLSNRKPSKIGMFHYGVPFLLFNYKIIKI